MLHHFFDDRFWFKPKRFGLGAYPVAWQGWVLTIAYLGVILGMTRLGSHGGPSDPLRWTMIAAATLVFVGIAWRKTEGGWHWHWGSDDDDKGRGTGPGDGRRQPRDTHRKRRG